MVTLGGVKMGTYSEYLDKLLEKKEEKKEKAKQGKLPWILALVFGVIGIPLELMYLDSNLFGIVYIIVFIGAIGGFLWRRIIGMFIGGIIGFLIGSALPVFVLLVFGYSLGYYLRKSLWVQTVHSQGAESIIHPLKDESSSVRKVATETLGETGDREEDEAKEIFLKYSNRIRNIEQTTVHLAPDIPQPTLDYVQKKYDIGEHEQIYVIIGYSELLLTDKGIYGRSLIRKPWKYKLHELKSVKIKCVKWPSWPFQPGCNIDINDKSLFIELPRKWDGALEGDLEAMRLFAQMLDEIAVKIAPTTPPRNNEAVR